MGEPDHPAWVTVPELVARFVVDPDLGSTLRWLTDRCAEVPGVCATAVLLAGENDVLEIAAASSNLARWLCELESRGLEGPAQDSYDNGYRVDCADLSAADTPWPQYGEAALRVDVRAVHAFALCLPGQMIGAMTIHLSETGGLSNDVLETAQALANAVALGVASHQASQDKARADQLQGALDSRVLIEQAKGVLAERLGITPGEAFAVLRQHARHNQVRLVDVSTAVLEGRLSLTVQSRR